MVLQPDFRKVSGISTEIFRQLESVENDHDATTAAALGAVERRGEMLVRMLDPRLFSRPAQEIVRKLLSMQDALHAVHFVEIVKRPGQTLGLYIREGNGLDRYDGVFISRIAIESAVFNSGCLGVGDEILAVNLVDVTHMSLDDVVILMSIPRRLVLTIRQRKGQRIMSGGPTQSILRTESKHPPVVVIKKELGTEEDGYEDSNGENGHIHSALSHQYFQHQVNHYANLSHGQQLSSLGRGRTSTLTTMAPQPTGGRLFSAGPGGPPSARSILSQQQGPHSIQSLPRHYQPSYANLQLQHLPDVTDYARMSGRHEDFRDNLNFRRLEPPQPPIRRPQYSDYYDQMRPEPPPRPSSQQGGYLSRHEHGPSSHGPASTGSYDWYRASLSERGAPTTDSMRSHHAQTHHQHQLGPSLQQHEPTRDMTTASISYQPPPPVITEQPRSIVPAHFQPFDRAYPKTLESLAEKVHTFYTGPRPVRHHGPHGPGRSSLRMPRTGSDHRLSISSREHNWYGSMPRQRTGDYRSLTLQQPLTPSSQAQAQQQLSARYSSALSSRLQGMPSGRRKPVLDYASDSEAMSYTPSMRSAGLSLPASTRRSLGLTNGRSNSLPRDLIRGRGGRKQNVRFDKRGIPDLTSSLAGRRALLMSSGIHSEDESDGAASAPEMPTPRRERGRVPSSPGVFTSAEYRAWLTRAPSTSAIYERLKTNRDLELIQTQRAAKFTFSAENLSLLDRARNRTERYAKILNESTTTPYGRDNQSNLALWEARLKTQDQPYYSYRSHLMSTGLTGGDSTLARALAGRSPSAASTLASLGIGQSPSREVAKDQPSTPSDTLRRLGITPSRSRDIISSFTASTQGVVTSTSTGITIDPTGGRTTPTSALLHRMAADKESDAIMRKEIISRSILTRDIISRERESMSRDRDSLSRDRDSLSRDRDLLARERDTLKEELEEKTEKLATRLSSLTSGGHVPSVPLTGTTPASILTRTPAHHVPHHPVVAAVTATATADPRLKLLTINPSEFLRYKIERPSSVVSDASTNGVGGGPHGHSGILRVHLLAGRALRSTVRSTDSSVRTRDLYCVLECDRVHKARTVVCTGDQNFDWDEVFELDLVGNKELDFLIYSWDPQLRHRLCYKGSVNLLQILSETPGPGSICHQLAIKVEPRGTLYVKLKHTPPQEAFKRELKSGCLFGGDVSNVVIKEDSGLNVPLIVQRCIEEIERRGLDIIGLYRLCGSATKKQTLREAFERSPRVVDLSAENVPDINVIAGVLKDYLRELPEPLLTKCLYQMLVDALGVCLPDDPEGNARLLFSIIECLPKPNRCTLLLILEHLSLVCSLSDRNKMGPTQLAGSFGPILMVHHDGTAESLDFQPPIKVLQYLLEVWPAKSVALLQTVRAAGAEAVRKGPSLLGKGRPFPRSSPTSILSSRSQKTTPSKTSLHLSPSKQSPGSLSESSPSPTSTQAGTIAISRSGTSAITTVNMSSITTTSSSSGILTLTPSTTSSSLTSVTTPNSLTPVSSTAKSIAPATTSSNYSLTSEFSTTSVTSPIPGMKTSDTNEELFSNVSVRSRVSAFEVTTTTPGGGAVEAMEAISIYTTANMSSSTVVYPSDGSNEEEEEEVPTFVRPAPIPPQPPVPPSPFMGRKFAGGPGRAERAESLDDSGGVSTKRKLPPLPPSFSHPDLPPPSSNQYSQSSSEGQQQQQQARGGYPTSSPFYGDSQGQGGPGGRFQEQPSGGRFQEETSGGRFQEPTSGGRFQEPTSGGRFQEQTSGGRFQEPTSGGRFQEQTSGGRFQEPTSGGRFQEQTSGGRFQEQTSGGRFQEQTSGGRFQDQLAGGRFQEQPSGGRFQDQTAPQQNGDDDLGFQRGCSKPINVPPPPPPKPASARARREREMEGEESRSRSQSFSEEESPPDHVLRRSSTGDVQPMGGGVQQVRQQHQQQQGSNNNVSSPWSSSVTSSSTSTPTTVQSQSNSKGNSPGPATPGSTPPPVPPRLDRRPSQTSPTSSPPAMPPPVPPRLGRAAPVRTPSLDGREAFEVDCYTIKEENGEEDYLT